MRNSSLVKWFRAENVTGLKSATEAADFHHVFFGTREGGSGRGAFSSRMKGYRKASWTNEK